MSKRQRRNFSASFKAKVALEPHWRRCSARHRCQNKTAGLHPAFIFRKLGNVDRVDRISLSAINCYNKAKATQNTGYNPAALNGHK